jgi:transposase
MTQVDDLSRSLIAFEQNSTMVVVLEMSQSSWLAAGVVPGFERRPLKKLDPDPTALLRFRARQTHDADRNPSRSNGMERTVR